MTIQSDMDARAIAALAEELRPSGTEREAVSSHEEEEPLNDELFRGSGVSPHSEVRQAAEKEGGLAPADFTRTTYVPDFDGTGGPDRYKLKWSQLEDPWATGDAANADLRLGESGAGRHTINGSLHAYAGLGAWYTPLVHCRIKVTPFIHYSGLAALNSRIADPSRGEQEWACSGGYLGICIQSWDFNGHNFGTDANMWIPMWELKRQNPNNVERDYSGGALDGNYQVQIHAGGRNYAIWATCQAWVYATQGFAVGTTATTSMSCVMPSLTVTVVGLLRLNS
ncbi:hypothetical protein [Streptomyces sp. NPDC095613]|uniref:hypothetical protein n=1 Tax=Streptomyces sp. NPDC095613 TaxID=3155540 RepID=UPI003322FC08